jgi:ferredoxin
MKKHYLIIIALLVAVVLISAMITGKPFVTRSACVGCGDCVKHCPTKAVEVIQGKAIIDTETCIDCGLCIKACQYQAIRRPK